MALSKLTDIRKSLSVEVEDLQVNGITTFTNSVSIGGTLTYQDVTNIDSVGLITARSGINVSGGTATFAGDVSIADKIIHTGDTNTAIRFPAADTFAVETAASERLRITSAGRVGIATDTGNGLINTRHAGTNQQVLHVRADLGSSNNRSINLYTPDTDNASAPFRFQTGNGYLFQCDSEDVFTIAHDRRIGIGTDNPSSLLTLDHATNPSIQFKDSGTKVASINSEGTSTNIASFESKDLLFACSASSAFTERLRIKSNGLVGIGTDNPNRELTVYGADPIISVQEASVSSQVDIGTGTVQGFINIQKADGTRTVQISSSGDTYFNGGNVGIGTNNPSQIFNICGTNVKPVIGHITAHTPLYSSYNGQNNTSLEISSSGTGTNVAGLTINNPTTAANTSYKTISFSCSGTSSSEKRACIVSSNHDEDGSSSLKGNFYVSTNNGSGLQQNLQINHDGHVRKPNQPSFHVFTVSGNQSQVLTFGSTHHNNGNHMNASTGTFTCPVAGRYLFTFAFLHSNSPTSYARVLFRINGSRSTQYGDTLCDDTGLYVNTSMSMIFNLSANDTVQLYNEGNNIYGSQYGAFSGILLA